MKLEDYKKYPAICCIYQIKNTVTNKIYIGSCIDLHARFIRHMYYLNHNIHHSAKLQRSFNKYGISIFDVEIIDTFLISDNIEILEESLIKKYDCVKNGYNCIYSTRRTSSFKLTQEQIQKRIMKSSKPVIAINRFTGEIEKEFNSISDAANFYKTSSSNISQVCKGKANHLKGMIFRYKKEYNGEKITFVNNYNKGISKSELVKSKMVFANPFSNPVFQYDLEMNLIHEFPSRNRCIKETMFGDYQIRKSIKNKTPLNGYYFIQNSKI